MKIKSRVSKFGKDRKIIELPKTSRDNFKIAEEVYIEKIPKEKKVKQ